MVLVVAWSWYLHGSLHHVHINALTSGKVALGKDMDLGASAALILGDEAEATLVLCSRELVGSGAWEALCYVLEA
jgi:hypothetical protein